MPQQGLYGLRGLAQLSHPCRKAVPCIVHAHIRKPCTAEHAFKGPIKTRRVQRLTVDPAKDEPVILIRLSEQQLLFRLPSSVLFQGG
jgi:hypothetical protein